MVRLRLDVLRRRWRRIAEIPTGLQRRFEGSLLGETVISGVVAIVVIINIAWNLPPSEVQRRAMPVLDPIASVTGLGQSWAMYAPDPVSRHEVLDAGVTMSDGSKRVWTPAGYGQELTPFVWYHWQKLKEQAAREPQIRAGLARWVVREVTEPSEHPVLVEIILRSHGLPPPGEAGVAEQTVETLYSETLSGQS